MNTRLNPFADLKNVPVFERKPKPASPVAREVVDQIAKDNDFPSRQAPRATKEARRRRRYTTGRNEQINIRATARTKERFIAMADEKCVPSGALLELALDALEQQVRAEIDPRAGGPNSLGTE